MLWWLASIWVLAAVFLLWGGVAEESPTKLIIGISMIVLLMSKVL